MERTWWIIDERANRIDTIPINAKNVEDAVWEGKIKWFGLTEWEKEQRIRFSVALAPVDEDGFCDLDDITEEYPFKRNEME